MEPLIKTPIFHVLFSIFISLLLCSGATKAASGVIDNIDIIDKTSPPQLRINFTTPLQYLNHAPESAGDEIQIQLQNISSNLFSRESELQEQQTVTARPSERIPFLDARYEQLGVDRGIITVRFSRSVKYSVQAGADRRHINISILSSMQSKGRSEQVDELSPSIQPEPMEEVIPPVVKQPPGGTSDVLQEVTPTITADMLKKRYIINLESSIQAIKTPVLADLKNPDQYIIYTTRLPIDGRVWNRLRVGFFATRKEAQKVAESLKAQYPRAWIQVATEEEILEAFKEIASPEQPASTAKTVTPPADSQQLTQRRDAVVVSDIKPTLPSTSDERIAGLMEEARQAISRDDNNRAIQLYTKVIQYPDNPHRQDALEFLGVARERKGQLAHAIKEYKRYLSLYPEGEGAERVKQRLAGLTTASRKPTPSKGRSTQAMEDRPWDVYGGFSQFYRRDEISTDDVGSTVTQSALSTDLDVTARKRTDDYDLQSRFTGSYLRDFLGDGPGNENSISSLYVDASGKRLGASMRLGRQSRNTGGVLGRFDGLLLGYKLTDWMTVNAVGGFPVFSTRDGFHTDRQLYGLSTDLGTFSNAWDFNLFVIEQRVESVVDRRAVGGEARYFDPIRSLLTFVDYDILYGSLNTVIFLGTWTLPDRTTINATFDYRNSPILTTSNALQGQSAGSIDDLLDTLTEEDIQELAKDRTGHSTTATLGASHPFTEKIQLSGDVTVSELSGTKASGGIEAIPDTGKEYFYNLQLIGSNLFKTGDTSILGTRYSDTSTAKIYTVSLDSRYPVIRAWRINPRMRLNYRENDNDDSSQWTALPSLRMDYRWRKRYRFEIEGGKEWTTRDFTDRSEDSSSYYLSMGYRADF
jgi:tetratricopeptide (TPR) repeat protein